MPGACALSVKPCSSRHYDEASSALHPALHMPGPCLWVRLLVSYVHIVRQLLAGHHCLRGTSCGTDHDQYTDPLNVGPSPPRVEVQIFISGAPASGAMSAPASCSTYTGHSLQSDWCAPAVTVEVFPDYSVLVVDNPNGGIDIYQAQYGHLYATR